VVATARLTNVQTQFASRSTLWRRSRRLGDPTSRRRPWSLAGGLSEQQHEGTVSGW